MQLWYLFFFKFNISRNIRIFPSTVVVFAPRLQTRLARVESKPSVKVNHGELLSYST